MEIRQIHLASFRRYCNLLMAIFKTLFYTNSKIPNKPSALITNYFELKNFIFTISKEASFRHGCIIFLARNPCQKIYSL